jgi:type II secretory pathway predicted ATPase ExeA
MNNKDKPAAQIRHRFGLKFLPFAKEVGTTELFSTPIFAQARQRLTFLVERGGIGVLSGPPGLGKSSLVWTFLEGLNSNNHFRCTVEHSACGTLDVLRQIACGLELDSSGRKGTLVCQIKRRVLQLSREQRLRVVLAIEEAQLLPHGFLDEIRLLSSFDGDTRDEWAVILVGDSVFEGKLRLAVNEAFRQRVIVHVRLHSLTAEEVAGYIAFRLERAGGRPELFDAQALELIAKASGGTLRRIDRFAEEAFWLAAQNKASRITAEIAIQAVEEVTAHE